MPTIPIRWADNTDQLRRNLAQGLNQIEATRAAADKMVKSLSGENLLRSAATYAAAIDKIGGAQKLTASNQERVNAVMQRAVEQLEAAGKGSTDLANHYRMLAQQTELVDKTSGSAKRGLDGMQGSLASVNNLLGLFGVGLSAASAIGFAKSLMDMAGQLSDLSAATGVSVEGLQRLGYVGVSSGVSMDEMGRAVGTLSERLASGDQSAVDAVNKLGLSVDALLAAGPEEAFIAIGEAVGQVEDPMQKNALAADLFGSKLAKQLIPALGDLRKAMQDVPKEAVVSNQDIQAIAELGDRIDELTLKWKAYAATRLLAMVRPSNEDWERMAGPEFANQMRNAGRSDIALPATPPELPPGLIEGYRQGADAVDEMHAAFAAYADVIARVRAQIDALNRSNAASPVRGPEFSFTSGTLPELDRVRAIVAGMESMNRGSPNGSS